MRSRMLLFLSLLAIAATVFSLDEQAVARADDAYEDDLIDEAYATLQGLLPTARTGAERAEVLWRLSRVALALGERLEDQSAARDQILARFEEGERYGIRAVEEDPSNHLGYYWQSANIGKWGQTRGILSSLFKAAPMRDLLRATIAADPTHAPSYYVLGRLYSDVPGGISFGNVDYAVGLGRRSVALHEAERAAGITEDIEHDFYIRLAGHLIKRNWNAARRTREQERKASRYQSARDELERGWHFEGTVSIPAVDDRQEARTLLSDMIAILEGIPARSAAENRRLATARELLAGL